MGKKESVSGIQWKWAVIAGFSSLVIMVLGHVLFVAFYSHLMHPGFDTSYYRDFAQKTGAPFVILFGPPVLYILSRWMADKVPGRGVQHAILMVLVFVVLDILVLMTASQSGFFLHPANLIAQVAKAGGALAGGFLGDRANAASA